MGVVTGLSSQRLEAKMNSATGFYDVVIENVVNMPVNDKMAGGRIKGHLEVRDKTVAALAADLDTFAADFAASVNQIHRANFNLNGTDGVDLIAPPAATKDAARNLAVNALVAANPDLLAASGTAAGVPGNGVPFRSGKEIDDWHKFLDAFGITK